MKYELVRIETQKVIYSYDLDKEKVSIKDRDLEKIMKNIGFTAFELQKSSESDQREKPVRVQMKLGDEGFHKAFLEQYFPKNYDKNLYRWQTAS